MPGALRCARAVQCRGLMGNRCTCVSNRLDGSGNVKMAFVASKLECKCPKAEDGREVAP
jgi:hypothetical protein